MLLLSGCVTDVIGDYVEPASRVERQSVQLRLARGYYRLGEYRRAHEAAERALALRRPSADLYEVMALIEAALGYSDEASAHFKKSVRLQKSNSRIWNNYGVFLYDEGDFEAACKAFARAIADPNYPSQNEAIRNLERCRKAQRAPH